MKRREQTVQWIRSQVNKDSVVVVALSGGPDSVLLLDLMQEAAGDGRFAVEAAHLNHGLRKVSEDEEVQLKATCMAKGIAFISKRVDCAAFAKENRLTLEEAGRRMRYAFFAEVLGDQKGWIATGHHKNDQAETILFHLFRGSGARGLRGIPALEPPIMRPLFHWKREEILEACALAGLSYFTDETNEDTMFTRNWIRQDLLPRIEDRFDAGVVDRIVQTSELLAADDAYLHKQAKRIYEELAVKEANGVTLSRHELQSLESPILSRVLFIALERTYGTIKDISYEQIKRAMEMIRTGHAGRMVEFSMGRRFRIGSREILFSADEGALDFEIPLSIPGVTHVPGGIVKAEWRIGEEGFNDPFTIEIDYDRIQSRLFWRTQQQGDWFSLAHDQGRKRLNRFWIDQKVPQHQRAVWPLLAEADRILWVVGLRKCEEKPSAGSKVVRIHYQVFEGGHHEEGY